MCTIIEFQEKVCEKIKAIRLKNIAPVIELAKACGYETEKGYYDLEAGRVELKLKHLISLSKYYKISIDYFLYIDK